MSADEIVTASSVRLEPATAADRAAIVALQHDAYDANRHILGVEPMPLQADYDAIFAAHETWVVRAERDGAITAVLFVEVRPNDVLIWSIATDPASQGRGYGKALLEAAEIRACARDRYCVRLYTGEKLVERVAWYKRSCYTIERREVMPDRVAVHMVKPLVGAPQSSVEAGIQQG
jgi:GNAT superfamily N-acetyltransferase